MKNKIKRMKIMIIRKIVLLLFITLMASPVWALTTGGTPIIAIDGNGDPGVTVDIQSFGFTAPYTYGYFILNGPSPSTFNALAGGLSSNTFQGGDIIDFALSDGTNYYTLSGDAANDGYSVLMTFDTQVTVGAAQQPAGWTLPYYHNANITWYLPTTVNNTNEFAVTLANGNDGIAPVPEPSTLLLLGSGLAGLGFFGRNRRKRG